MPAIFMAGLIPVASILIYGLSTGSQTHITGALVLFFLFTAIAPLLGFRRQGAYDLFEPIYPVLFMSFLFYGLPSFILPRLMRDPAFSSRLPDMDLGVMNLALIYVILGVLGLLIGYNSNLPHRLARLLPELTPHVHQHRFVYLTYFLVIIGWLCRLIVMSKGYHTAAGYRGVYIPPGYHAVSYLGLFLPRVGFVLGLLAYYRRLGGPGLALFVWCITLPLELFFVSIVGGKSNFVLVLLAPLMARHYLRRRVSGLWVLVGLVLMMFFVFPIMGVYRFSTEVQTQLKPGTLLEGSVALGSTLLEWSSNKSLFQYLWEAVGIFFARFFGVSSFVAVIQHTPEILPFQLGKTIWAIPIMAFVPQFVWPGRDDFLGAYEVTRIFATEYLGFELEAGGQSITQMAELYLNFHWPGVVVGMFTLGVLYRFVYLYLMRQRHLINVMIYLTLFPWIVMSMDFWFFHMFENMLKQLAIVLIVSWFVCRGPLFIRHQINLPSGLQPMKKGIVVGRSST